ncbi:MAG TPA: helix-turn-helix domain-containing protein [Longimicrobium sp.]
MTRLGERTVLITATPALRALARRTGEYQPRWFDGWDDLAGAMETAPPAVTVIADAYLGAQPGAGPSPRLRELLEWRPSIPVIAALPLVPEHGPDAVALFAWGVSQVLDLLMEARPAVVQARLRDTRARPLKRRVEAILSQYASENARNLLRAASEVAVEGGGAPELARLFGADPRTVAAWCRREGLPAPRRLLAWTRVLLAAMLLREEGRSIVNSARGAGYATDHALRRAMRELVGGDPATISRGELFDRAAERFNAELRDLREDARERSRPLPGSRAGALYG